MNVHYSNDVLNKKNGAKNKFGGGAHGPSQSPIYTVSVVNCHGLKPKICRTGNFFRMMQEWDT
jgi:hypothetical protein